MNRLNFLAAWVLGAATLFAGPAGGQENKKAIELEWAKGVAEDFLAAAIAGDSRSAELLVDTTMKASFARKGESALSYWLNNSVAIQHFSQPAIAKEAISPDDDEAVFRGTMQRSEPKEVYDFAVRVVKEKDGGKWRVSMFRFSPAEGK
jgi:hypothetical protein